MRFVIAMLALPLVSACASASGPRAAPSALPTAERPAPGDTLVRRTITFELVGPRAQVVPRFLATELAVFLPGTRALPGVHHTEPRTDALFPAVGSVRRVHLADGHTADEEVLEVDAQHLRYLVTSYTSPAAAPVAYGLGEFRFADAGPDTRVTWSYAFKLRPERFPGSWGGLGRTLFRVRFLDAEYARFMESGRDAIVAWASRTARQGS